MRKRYEFVTTLILSLVTCGIYALIMWADMANNLNELDTSGEKDLANAWLAMLILTPITCGIYGIIWQIRFFTKLINVQKAKGVNPSPTDQPILLWLICCYIPIYSFYAICDNYNKAIA